jgi:UDP-3-O-[3-hydroxymyristoyl] glucosamine N-acyltransferase
MSPPDADQIRAALAVGDPDATLPSILPGAVSGVAELGAAGAEDLCFAEHADQFERVLASAARMVLIPRDFPDIPDKTLIRTAEPRRAFFAIATLFLPPPPSPGVHAGAHVHGSARLGTDVSIGAGAVVGANSVIGARSVLAGGVQIGDEVEIGADCTIEANVAVLRGSRIGARCVLRAGAVVGSDGFGFVWDGAGHRKVPQLGRVVLEDDVDIGCNSCIDRATLGETRIGRGTKVDNLVQIAHNVVIGEHAILVSQSGVAGSSTLGTGAVIAGQVAVSDHVDVGAGARVGGQSGVTKDVAAGATVFGTPARDIKRTLREMAALEQLPAMLRQVRGLEREVATLRGQLPSANDD